MPGNRRPDILAVQRVLKKLGFYEGKLNEFYSEGIKQALFKFQKSKDIASHNGIIKPDLN